MENETILTEESTDVAEEIAEEQTVPIAETGETAETGQEPAQPAVPATEETIADADPADAESAEPMRYPVSYGEDTRELTVEEMTAYAQRGMQYDEIAPVWDNLCRMASERGETPEQLIGAIAAAEERVMYERFLKEANGNRGIADRLLELEKNKRQAAATATLQAKQTAAESAKKEQTERLAAEYLELKAEFPELAEFKDIPQVVVQTAVKSKVHLLDAYLRYRHVEDKKIAQNNQTAAKAAAGAMGSMSADVPDPDSVDPYVQAMLDGVRAAL